MLAGDVWDHLGKRKDSMQSEHSDLEVERI